MSLKPNDGLRLRSDYPGLDKDPAYGPGTLGAVVPATGRVEALTPDIQGVELNSAQAFISRVMIGHVQRLEENSKRWIWLREQADAPALVLLSTDEFDKVMKERGGKLESPV